MTVLGVLACQVLELEFAQLLVGDPDVDCITVVEDNRSVRMIQEMESEGARRLRRVPHLKGFTPATSSGLEALVRVLELALHNRKKNLQESLMRAAREMKPYVDALLLGYGLCGNALENPQELLAEAGVPVFIPMDDDHPVDDCVGLIIGGRNCYYGEQCKVAGTFFMTPGWTTHWKRLFDQDFGRGMSVEMFKRLFAHYERSLLLSTSVMPVEDMERNVKAFNELLGLRSETREGDLRILKEAWAAAKKAISRNRV